MGEVLPNLQALGAKASDIMLLNFGLHTNNLSEYKYQLSLFHHYFKRYKADMPFVIWRETSPQHFKTRTGEFACPDCEVLQPPFMCVVCSLLHTYWGHLCKFVGLVHWVHLDRFVTAVADRQC